jgi:hypothetical protein
MFFVFFSLGCQMGSRRVPEIPKGAFWIHLGSILEIFRSYFKKKQPKFVRQGTPELQKRLSYPWQRNYRCQAYRLSFPNAKKH